MLTRRDYLKNSALAGAACLLPSDLLRALERSTLITPATSKPKHMLDNIGAAYPSVPTWMRHWTHRKLV